MNSELISVIVPIYNVEKYINKCVDSIINQTYKNIEIILVDDGSTDNCYNICDEYKKKDNRIKVIHQENSGLSEARNAGIKMAKGEYLAFVDGDDYILEDMLEYLYKLLKETNSEISVCNFIRYWNEDKKLIDYNINRERIVIKREQALKEILKNDLLKSFAWNKLYKKSLFKNVRYPKGMKMEDVATTYKLISNSEKIVIGKDAKYYYVQRDGSILATKSTSMYIDYYKAVYERYKFLDEKYPNLKKQNVNTLINFLIGMNLVNDKKLKEYIDQNNTNGLLKEIVNSKSEAVSIKNKIKLKFIYKYLIK